MFRSGFLVLLVAGLLAGLPLLNASPATASQATTAATAKHIPRVEVYGTKWCPYCQAAVKFFRSRGVPVVEYDVETDQAAAKRKETLDPKPGVPYTVIDGHGIHGYSAPLYEKLLKAATAGH